VEQNLASYFSHPWLGFSNQGANAAREGQELALKLVDQLFLLEMKK